MEVKEKQEELQKTEVVESAAEQDGYTLDEVVQRSARRGGRRASRAAVVPLILAIVVLGSAAAFALWHFSSNSVNLSGYDSASSEYNYTQMRQESGAEYPSFTHGTAAISPEQAKGMGTDELATYNDKDIVKCLLAYNAKPDMEMLLGETKDNNVLTFWGDGQQRISKIVYYLGTYDKDTSRPEGYTYPTSLNVYLDGELYGTMELYESKGKDSYYECQFDEPKDVTSVTLELTSWAKDKGTTNYILGQVAFE